MLYIKNVHGVTRRKLTMKNSKFLVLIVCTSLSTYAMQQGSEIEKEMEKINTQLNELEENFKKGLLQDLEVFVLENQNNNLKFQLLTDEEEDMRYSLKQKIESLSNRIKGAQRNHEEELRELSRYW